MAGDRSSIVRDLVSLATALLLHTIAESGSAAAVCFTVYHARFVYNLERTAGLEVDAQLIHRSL